MQAEYTSAASIAHELKAKRDGRGWMARCPAHDDRNPSFSIRQAEDRVLVHCFAGCSQDALIAALRARNLWAIVQDEPSRMSRSDGRPSNPSARDVDHDRQARFDAAMRWWRQAGPLDGSLGERYFVEHRKQNVRPLRLAHCLRYHADTRAVVALMTDAVSGEPVGIHRTFLDCNGAKIDRKMLGRQGVVRLTPDADVTGSLGLTEGLEDSIAALISGWAPVWAATSAGAMARFPVLAGIEALTIFADSDDTGLNAARACCSQWRQAGRDANWVAPAGRRHE
jgi:putative DNA primase/helicase